MNWTSKCQFPKPNPHFNLFRRTGAVSGSVLTCLDPKIALFLALSQFTVMLGVVVKVTSFVGVASLLLLINM